jgi:hypothetical protein
MRKFHSIAALRGDGLLIYCADYHCSHSIAISADQWPDHVRLSDLESGRTSTGTRHRGAFGLSTAPLRDQRL